MTDITRGPYRAIMPADARKPITIETEWRHEGAQGGVVIATVHHHGTSRLRARANARAFAAMPDLLQVARELADATPGTPVEELQERARAALARLDEEGDSR